MPLLLLAGCSTLPVAPDARGPSDASAAFSSTPDVTLSGESTGDTFGWAIAGVGDVDADGYDDVLVGAHLYSTSKLSETGRAYLYRGSSTGLSTTAAATFTGTSDTDYYGFVVAGVGDLDGDGYDDVAINALLSGSANQGEVEVYLGNAGGLGSTPAYVFTGDTTSTTLGSDIAGPSDVNGDGWLDLVFGGYNQAVGATSAAGSFYVWFGGAGGFGTTYDQAVYGTRSSELLGYHTVAAGDVDGDGFDDILVGAPGTTEDGVGYGGTALLYLGTAGGLDTTPTWTVAGTTYNETVGVDLDAVGDIDGDGYPELVVGDPGDYGWSGSTAVGVLRVFRGGAAGYSTTPDQELEGDGGSWFARITSAAGDVDGDGHADVLVGAPRTDGGGGENAAGEAFLFYGGTSGLETTAGFSVLGTLEGGALGGGTAALGDVDGDGLDDFAFGAIGTDEYEYTDQKGEVEVWSGSIAGHNDGDGDGVATAGDCDDADATVGAAATWYADADGDGYGLRTSATVACTQPEGTVADASDCDDADATVGPSGSVLYEDADGDGHGTTAATIVDCGTAVEGWASAADDCDDARADVSPDAAELCDDADVDEDCDGAADDADPSAAGLVTWYRDDDADGYGDAATALAACEAPRGYVTDATDCDDTRKGIHPAGSETCDSSDRDEDCDGLVDDADPSVDASTLQTWYTDADGDFFGSTPVKACDAPAGAVETGGDCDDTQVDVHPGGIEVCDAADVDEDCDGLADDADPSTMDSTMVEYFHDGDGDGYGGTVKGKACDLGPDAARDSGDCDDGDASVYLDAAEVCDDGVDQDCDGVPDDGCESGGGGGGGGGGSSGGGGGGGGGGGSSGGGGGGGDTGDVDTGGSGGAGGGGNPVDTSGSGGGGGEDTAKDEPAGCGCASGPAATSAWGLLLGAVLVARRRR